MKSVVLTRELQRIRSLVNLASGLAPDQLEMQSHWARYLCVLSAGFIENALVDVYSRYAKSCANENVSNFVEGALIRIQSPKAHRFVETANAFQRQWGEELHKFMESGGRKEAIDSIMANRHLIAHGENSGISLVRVKQYLDKSVEVIEFLEFQCGF